MFALETLQRIDKINGFFLFLSVPFGHPVSCWNAGNAVLVGGVSSNGQTFSSDTWYYDEGWTQASPATALPPVGYHQAVYAEDRIWLVAEGGLWVYE